MDVAFNADQIDVLILVTGPVDANDAIGIYKGTLLLIESMKSFRPHLHISGYPCKRILLKTFTQTIYTKMLKIY